MNYRPIVF